MCITWVKQNIIFDLSDTLYFCEDKNYEILGWSISYIVLENL